MPRKTNALNDTQVMTSKELHLGFRGETWNTCVTELLTVLSTLKASTLTSSIYTWGESRLYLLLLINQNGYNWLDR